MNVAIAALRDDRVPIAAVADQLGYESEAAFSRAFKRIVGQWPGEARRATHPPATPPSAASAPTGT